MYGLTNSFRLNAQQQGGVANENVNRRGAAAAAADSNRRQGTTGIHQSTNPLPAGFSLNAKQGPYDGANEDDDHGEDSDVRPDTSTQPTTESSVRSEQGFGGAAVTESLNLASQRPIYHEIEPRSQPAVSTTAYTATATDRRQTHNDSRQQPNASPNEATLSQQQQQQQQRQPHVNGDDDSTPGVSNTVSSRGTKWAWPTCLTRNVVLGFGLLLALLVVASVLLALYIPDDNPSYMYTMDVIKARGNLKCGVGGKLGFSAVSSATGKREGFEIDLCRAVGAALFGEDGHVQYTVVSSDDQFTTLQSKEVDLLAAGTVFTIQRDVFEPSTKTGFTFSAPYLYEGLGFAGQPQFVACAEALNTSGTCSNLTICVQDITTNTDLLTLLLPSFSGIKLAPTKEVIYNDFKQNLCKVIAADRSDLMQSLVTQVGYTGDYGIGSQQFSKVPLALVTRDDDVQWSDFVNWVLLGLLSAENQNINQTTAASAVAKVDDYQIPFYDAVATVGNFGEIYQRNLQSLVPRASVNMLNNGTTPLISSIPFGDTSINGPGPTRGGTLERILQRGFLRCGISAVAFFTVFDSSKQQWSGLDADYCRAVAAGVFGASNSSNTIFVEITAANRFQELANGNVDIIARSTTVTYARDVDEPTTRKGFSFSLPYFISGVQFGGIPPYGQCADQLKVFSQCQNLLICVTNGTTTIERVRSLFPARYIVSKPTNDLVAKCLAKNESNAIAGDGFDTANVTIRKFYSGPYESGTNLFSRENFAIMTNQDDAQWSSFVFLVVTATIYAEEQRISQVKFGNMHDVNFFGPRYTSMLKDVIRAVGNYGEMYVRSAASKYFRSKINQLNYAPYGPQHNPPLGLFGLT